MPGNLRRTVPVVAALLLTAVFFLAPLGESSPLMEIVEHATETPPPAEKFTTFSPVPVIDISNEDLVPRKLTQGGCCAYPGWSLDSEWIMVLNGGAEGEDVGLYSIPRDGGRASLVTERFGLFSRDWSLVAYPEGGQTYLEQWAVDKRWTIPSSGRAVSVSPDNRLVAWEFGSQRIQSPDRRQTQVWVADVDGGNARELVTLHGGGFHGWLENGKAILATGRLSPTSPAGIWRIYTVSGAAQLLFEVENARSLILSPKAEWLAFTIAFEQDASRNGLWVLRTDGSFTQRLRGFGSYRWRSEGHLLLIPLELGDGNPDLYEIDIRQHKIYRLIDPDLILLDITNNDWSVSPNGVWIVFQSYQDRNLWVLELPESPDSP